MPASLTTDSFRKAVSRLAERDGRLGGVIEAYGHPPFWRRPPGFATLVLFILEQQVSLASARAAFARLEARLETVTPEAVLSLDDGKLRALGLSRQKARYVRALAAAVASGALDLAGLARLSDEKGRDRLTAVPGIGRWTADVYLLSCLRRPDVWPVGDRALQVATAEVLGLAEVPDTDDLEGIGERWRPHRASAARILWHGYLSVRGRLEPDL